MRSRSRFFSPPYTLETDRRFGPAFWPGALSRRSHPNCLAGSLGGNFRLSAAQARGGSPPTGVCNPDVEHDYLGGADRPKELQPLVGSLALCLSCSSRRRSGPKRPNRNPRGLKPPKRVHFNPAPPPTPTPYKPARNRSSAAENPPPRAPH